MEDAISSSQMKTGSRSRASQQHHFIPRFILRSFRPDEQPPAGPTASTSVKRRSTKKQKPKSQRRDFLVNKIDLDNAQLTQRPVSQENALVNMYRDPGFSENPFHLEKELSRLEKQTSEILRKACDVFARDETLILSRHQKNIVRKFLFLMKYRNLTFFDRFNHDTLDEYDGKDKATLGSYMEKKGFTSPRQVWFDNLRVFLEVDIDADFKWVLHIVEQAYPDDAELFYFHIQCQFMAFCKPESSGDEFILTENAYGVFEGPTNPSFDHEKNRLNTGISTEYHNFGPVSPKLIIILRNCLLASPTEEGAPEMEAVLKREIDRQRSLHCFPEHAVSILQDLPIKKSTNSSSKVEDGRAIRIPRQQHPSAEDQFYFQCFPLSTTHVHLINEIFLEEAYRVSSIIYRSHTSLRSTLEVYLPDTREQFKVIHSFRTDPRRRFLETLVEIVRALGSNVTLVASVSGLLDFGRTQRPFDMSNSFERIKSYMEQTERGDDTQSQSTKAVLDEDRNQDHKTKHKANEASVSWLPFYVLFLVLLIFICVIWIMIFLLSKIEAAMNMFISYVMGAVWEYHV